MDFEFECLNFKYSNSLPSRSAESTESELEDCKKRLEEAIKENKEGQGKMAVALAEKRLLQEQLVEAVAEKKEALTALQVMKHNEVFRDQENK